MSEEMDGINMESMERPENRLDRLVDCGLTTECRDLLLQQ